MSVSNNGSIVEVSEELIKERHLLLGCSSAGIFATKLSQEF
jgi:hypothetical protein